MKSLAPRDSEGSVVQRKLRGHRLSSQPFTMRCRGHRREIDRNWDEIERARGRTRAKIAALFSVLAHCVSTHPPSFQSAWLLEAFINLKCQSEE